MGRLFKNLSGQSEKVFVAPNAVITAQTTYAAFVNNTSEADGTMGIFLDTGAIKTTALTAGQKFFVAQKRDAQVQRTPVISWDDLKSKVRTAYAAQVNQVRSIGYHPTAASTATIGFSFTGASTTNTLTFGIAARETTPGNQPFPVQEGYATVTSATADQYAVLASIVSQLNFAVDYERAAPDPFVIAEIQQSGTTAAITVAATLAVTNQSQTVVFNAAPTGAPAVGGLIAIGGTGNAGIVYKITAIAADTVTYTLDRPYTGASNTALAIANVLNITGYVSGTTLLGVRFTSIFPESTFVIGGTAGLIAAPTVQVTAWTLGSGYGSNIVELESREEAIFDGVGSTINARFASDYGLPARFGTAVLTYDQIFLIFAPSAFPGANPVDYDARQVERLHIATVVGTTHGSVMQTVFGL